MREPKTSGGPIENELKASAALSETLQDNLGRIRALAEWKASTMPPSIAADTALQMVRELANGTIQNSDAQREVLEAYMLRAMQAEQAEQSEPDPDEVEAQALLDSFDGRITEIEQRIDRVSARLDVG